MTSNTNTIIQKHGEEGEISEVSSESEEEYCNECYDCQGHFCYRCEDTFINPDYDFDYDMCHPCVARQKVNPLWQCMNCKSMVKDLTIVSGRRICESCVDKITN